MKLYLLVWECEEYAEEAEWLHFVAEAPLEYEAQLAKAKEFMQGEADIDEFNITNIWLNEVTSVDGYNVEVSKK